MDVQQRGIITLVKSAIDGCYYEIPKDFILKDAIKVALKHRVFGLIYYGAINCGISKECDEMKQLFSYLISSITIENKQDHATKQVFTAFEKNEIDFLPMKGTLIKTYYPKTEMRIMGDVDILIRYEQYDRIAPLMTELGYAFCYESDHELVWKKDGVCIELHKRMMTSYNCDLYSFWGDGWKFAKKDGESRFRYRLTDEDFYIYMFIHFTKHYRASGIGIKHLVDDWVYRRSMKHMDEQYIRSRLQEVHLLEFYENVVRTTQLWFEDLPADDKTEHITQVLFDSREYGIKKNGTASRLIRNAQKAGSVSKVRYNETVSNLFLPYKAMCEKHKVLERIPILLPVFWVYRWVKILIMDRKKLADYLNRYGKDIDKQVQQRRQVLNFVGLDFNFQEQEDES